MGAYIDMPIKGEAIEFVMNFDYLTPTDIFRIEDALRTLLIERGGNDVGLKSTLRKVARILSHPAATLVGGEVPVHKPGAYPSLSCCGGTKVILVPSSTPKEV